MKKIICVLLVISAIFTVISCSAKQESENTSTASQSAEETTHKISSPDTSVKEPEQGESKVKTILISVGGSTFTATLADNETAAAFYNLLPLTVDMSELNGNEKYYYLDTTLPSSPKNPGEIKEGDLMLYSRDCVVVFYKSFKTSYSYTEIGKIDDPSGLAAALGKSGVTVTFSAK